MSTAQKTVLLFIACLGFIIPNGMFFYYLFVEYTSVAAVFSDLLALSFIIDAFMATGLLAWWFAKNPLGKYSWKLFILLSLIGGLGFSLPFFYWLNAQHQNQ
ncbi:MAG: hypothetical protein WCW40_01415 [Bacteroidota bacterium]